MSYKIGQGITEKFFQSHLKMNILKYLKKWMSYTSCIYLYNSFTTPRDVYNSVI